MDLFLICCCDLLIFNTFTLQITATDIFTKIIAILPYWKSWSPRVLLKQRTTQFQSCLCSCLFNGLLIPLSSDLADIYRLTLIFFRISVISIKTFTLRWIWEIELRWPTIICLSLNCHVMSVTPSSFWLKEQWNQWYFFHISVVTWSQNSQASKIKGITQKNQ